MKKNIYLAIALLISSLNGFSQTASDFTRTDCSGKSHTLFSELDAGKAVILFFEMGCSSCISGANNVESYYYKSLDSSLVRAYYLDYNAGSACSDVEAWKTNNSYTFPSFADAADLMSPYGFGMPLIVIIGGKNHKVFYKGGWNSTKVQAAVKAASGAALAVQTIEPSTQVSIFPNPNSGAVNISVSLLTQSLVNIEVYNLLGEKVMTIADGMMMSGPNILNVNTASLASGNYVVKISAGTFIATKKLTIN